MSVVVGVGVLDCVGVAVAVVAGVLACVGVSVTDGAGVAAWTGVVSLVESSLPPQAVSRLMLETITQALSKGAAAENIFDVVVILFSLRLRCASHRLTHLRMTHVSCASLWNRKFLYLGMNFSWVFG